MANNTELKLFKTKKSIRDFVTSQKQAGKVVGFVPTMGALHQGHISLIQKSLEETNITVVSIFVNPTQFGPNEDLHKYPKTLENDLEICSKNGVSAVFNPDVAEMYSTPENKMFMVVPPDFYNKKLCGLGRPGHFDGVATVVTKLFNIIPAQKAYFGQKDAQQLFILKKMAEDFFIPIEIITCPTKREPDGLACSSRNINLDKKSREIAPILYQTLNFIKSAYKDGKSDFSQLSKQLIEEIISKQQEISLEYFLAYDYSTFEKVDTLKNNTLIAIAAKINNVRLIDNIILE